MAMGARRGRPIAVALVAGMLATVAGAVVLVFQPAGARGAAALLFLAGLAAGGLVAAQLPAPRAARTVMERLNDVAFAAVLAFVSLLVGLALRPWLAVVPGLLCGILGGRALRQEGAAASGDGGAGSP
ncbi:MAG TPA: hypothetical protein VGM21_10260 [Actinomycetota bacterium]|jgi:hypothetical protein